MEGSGRKKESLYFNGYFLRTPPETVEMGRGPLRPAARQEPIGWMAHLLANSKDVITGGWWSAASVARGGGRVAEMLVNDQLG